MRRRAAAVLARLADAGVPLVDLNGIAPPEGDEADYAGVNATQAFPQGGDAIFVAPVAVLSQSRGNNLASVTVAITASADSQTVSIGANDYPLGSDASNTVAVAGVTFSVAYTASTKTFVIAADAIPSAFQDMVRSIKYVNSESSATTGDVVFSFTVAGGTTTATADATVTVYVPAVVDANGAGGNRTATFTEGGSAVALVAGNVSADLNSLAITITGVDNGTYEIVQIDGVDFPLGTDATNTGLTQGSTTFTAAVASGNITLTKTGGGAMTAADLSALLQASTFRSAVGDPVEGDRVFTFQPTDSDGYAGSATTTTITVEQAAVTSVAHTTAQSGNAEDTSTWVGGVVPGANDTITVAAGHAIVQNSTRRFGHSPATDDATPVIQLGTNATWTIKPGNTLYVQGDFRAANSGSRIILEGTGSLMFDPSNAGDPTTAVYKLELAHGDAMLITSGTSATARAKVGTVTGGGNANAIITRDGTTRGGKMIVEYMDFCDLGSGTAYGLDQANVYDNDGICSIKQCAFIRTGGVNQNFQSSGTDFIYFENNTFSDSITPSGGKTNIMQHNQGSAITTGEATFTGNIFDKKVYLLTARDVDITDNMFLGDWSTAGFNAWGSFTGNLTYTEDGGAKLPFAATCDNNVWVQNGSGTNQHGVDPRYATTSFSGNIYFQPNGNSYEGDVFLWQADTAGATTYTCRNNIVGYNGVGAAGKMFSLLQGPNITYVIENNSCWVGHDDNVDGHEQGMVGIGETHQGHEGMVSSLQGNLVLRESANPGWFLLQQNSTTTPTDVVTLADKNGLYNVSAGVGTSGGSPNPTGYNDGVMTADLFTASVPGANDVIADPGCVDPYRNFDSWDDSIGGDGSMDNAFTEMAKRHQLGFNVAYSLANFIEYILAGWQPTNPAFATSGPSGGVIGAAPFLSGGGSGGSGPAAATYHDNSDLDRWAYFEAQMLAYGQVHGEYIEANKNTVDDFGTVFNAGYYDFGYVAYTIAEYIDTDYAQWRAWGDAWLYVYDRLIIATGGTPAGYHKFTGGFLKKYQATGSGAARNSLTQVANYGLYNIAATPLSQTVDAIRSREVAYGIMNFCDADTAGVSRPDKAEAFMDQILTPTTGHFAQWFDNPPYVPSDIGDAVPSYFAPFMWALSSLACIQYLRDIGPDSRVLPWLITGATWVHTNCWSDVEDQHLYRLGTPTDYHWEYGADLDAMIGSVYWWLWLQTGNATYKAWGDAAFNAAFKTIGNDGAYLAGGKQFQQSYRWTFDGLLYRAQGNAAWG